MELELGKQKERETLVLEELSGLRQELLAERHSVPTAPTNLSKRPTQAIPNHPLETPVEQAPSFPKAGT